MEDFFDTNELQTDHIRKGKLLSCASCGLYRNGKNPKLNPVGKFKKKVMFIGNFPTEQEDQNNKLWTNGAGHLLQSKLKGFNFSLFNDGISLNAINCLPKENETATSYQIDCCRKRVQSAIKKYKPKMIVLLGASAVESVIGKYYKKGIGGIDKWRGWIIPDQQYNAYVCPIFHPGYINAQKKDNVAYKIWTDDIERIIKHTDTPFIEYPDFTEYINYCHTDKQFKEAIKALRKSKVFTLDYETTGLRPYRKGHKIVCTGVAVSYTKVYVWENTPFRDKLFGQVMKNRNIKKISHNSQFEDTWTSHCIGVDTEGWLHCSMNGAHVLDNRKGISGLKFQTYVNFGIANYDEDANPYLSGIDVKKYGANAINRIEEFVKKFGMEKLFTYCGLDNVFTYMLAMKQLKEISK